MPAARGMAAVVAWCSTARANHTSPPWPIIIIAMPLTGWIFVSATPKFPIVFFWLGEVPFLPMPEGIDAKATSEQFKELHETLAYGAIVLITLHIAAALKHHFIMRDNVLTRMLPHWRKNA